jgi:hypothetical protein
MLGVQGELAEHIIDVNEGSKPVKEWLRRFSPDKKATIKKEIAKLMASRFISEILHLDWLANPVLVQKEHGRVAHCWRSLNPKFNHQLLHKLI